MSQARPRGCSDFVPGRGEQQRVAAGLVVEALPLPSGEAGDGGLALAEGGEELVGGGAVELVDLQGVAGEAVVAAAAGDEGAAALREEVEPVEHPAALGGGEGLQVVDDEQGAVGGERGVQRGGAILGGEAGQVVTIEGAGEGVEDGGEVAGVAAFELTLALGVKLAGLGGHPELERVTLGGGAVRGFKGEGALADAAGAVDVYAPAPVAGVEPAGDLLKGVGAAEEGRGRGQVAAGACGWGGRWGVTRRAAGR